MHSARENATATLLKNGKVLITGGDAHPELTWTFYASAELYDPATGKFTMTGPMTAARAWARATLLVDGRVLITGGEGCANPKHCANIQAGAMEDLVSAEIYDPSTGKFTSTGSMSDALASLGATATLLPDGRVLVAGLNVGVADLYDPATGKFVRSGGETALESPSTATLLPNGKVLVTGNGGKPELYDEASGKFTEISLALPPGTPVAKSHGDVIDRTAPSTATLLQDGRVLLFADGYLETYDATTGACADAGVVSPGDNWGSATATLMPDGRVLFVGGGLASGTKTAVLYDPSGGPSRATDSALAALVDQTATLLPDGSVLIAGGQDSNSKFLASAELFKP
jgi:hypothetical protein